MKNFSTELKVGLFAVLVILILFFITIKVSERASIAGRGYEIKTIFSNVTGLKNKAPIELSGVQVGIVKDVELYGSSGALVTLLVNRRVQLPMDSQVTLRTRGFLGDTYVEIIPGADKSNILSPGGELVNTASSGDINGLINKFNDIASDIKAVTSSLRGVASEDGQSPINRIIKNLDDFTKTMKDITLNNQDNVNKITANLAAFTEELRNVIQHNVEESMENVASITRKIDQGKGSIGKLVNDEETVNKLNEAIDNLNSTLGGFKKLETEIGYHTEYLSSSEDFKHYVSLAIKPAPDKAFLLDFVSDPNPNPKHVERTTDVTVNNTTTTVGTHTSTIDRSNVRISAQLAKRFYDLQVRGGIIESSGGFGLDYYLGPFNAHASAYDFSTRYGERPHIKLGGELNITKNFFLLGGADDVINPNQSVDYFVGGGFRLVDEDIKSLLQLGGASSLMGK